MPVSRSFSPLANVSRLPYQLGLDRLASEDTRCPRVGFGDPRLCHELEEASESKNSSTNLVISFEEWLPDSELIDIGRSYVEECLMIGISPNRFAYTLIIHDENLRDKETSQIRGKRSAIHIKIIPLDLISGRRLQAYYAARDWFLTMLFLNDLAIRKGLSSPLDRSRERHGTRYRKPHKVDMAKAMIRSALCSTKRLPDGTPDPMAMLRKLRELGLEAVERASGKLGKRGVKFRFADHDKPLRLFGEHPTALNKYIEKYHESTTEHQQNAKRRRIQDLFTDGYLDRSPERAARIRTALQYWTEERRKFHALRYKSLVATRVPGKLDPSGIAGGGLRNRLSLVSKGCEDHVSGGEVEGALGTGAEPTSNHERDADEIVIAAVEKTGDKSTSINNEPTRNAKSEAARAKRNPDTCGAYPKLGRAPESVLHLTSIAIWRIHDEVERLWSGICSDLEIRRRGALSIVEEGRGLDLQGKQLDAPLGRLAVKAQGLGGYFGMDPAIPGPGEFVRRVRNPAAVAILSRKMATPKKEISWEL